jgi:hypothetical protein
MAQIELHYAPKKGGWAMRVLPPDEAKVRSVMSHFRTEAELRYGGEKIGEVYWQDDPGSASYERIGHAHWSYWYDPDAITRAAQETVVSHAINARRIFESEAFKAESSPEEYAIARQTMEYMDKAVLPVVRLLEAKHTEREGR